MFGYRDTTRSKVPWSREQILFAAHWRAGEDLIRRSTELEATYNGFAKSERRIMNVYLAFLLVQLVVLTWCFMTWSFHWLNFLNGVFAGIAARFVWKWGRLWHDSMRSAKEIRDVRASVAAQMAGYARPEDRN